MNGKDKIIIDGVTYVRTFNRNGLSACALCKIKAKCWDLYRYNTPCFGGLLCESDGLKCPPLLLSLVCIKLPQRHKYRYRAVNLPELRYFERLFILQLIFVYHAISEAIHIYRVVV